MNNKKYPNLKHWQPGQSGNPAGRKLGSKNISTIVGELLDQEASADLLANSSIAELVKNSSTSYAKAVVWVTIQKALQGNMQAIIWLTDQQLVNNQQSIVTAKDREEPIITSVIYPRSISTLN